MCGIPMEPPAEAARGKLSFEACLAHVGGADAMISPDGWEMIDRETPYYLWSYRSGACWCTACGQNVGPIRRMHGRRMACPHCQQEAEYRHEARGHSKLWDEFILYEWRRSAIDPEVIVCVAVDVWHDQRGQFPEASPKVVKPTAIYVFRPGEAVSIYKNHRWSGAVPGGAGDWDKQNNLRSEHTGGGARRRTVIDGMQVRRALDGTAIGRVAAAVGGVEGYHMEYPEELLVLIGNCAARPWLEYLAKCGQAGLARELRGMRNVSRDVVARPRARTPRELLGLTEAQWFEIKRDGIALREEDVAKAGLLRRIGLTGCTMREIREMPPYSTMEWLAHVRKGPYDDDDIWRLTRGVAMPDKLRRRMWRRILRDIGHVREWRDYYKALRELGEDMSDPMLLLPRDMLAMHDRKIAEAAELRRENERRESEAKAAEFRKRRLPELRRRFGFRAAGLELRPFESPEEIRAEGKVLRICIGGYVQRYMDGGTVICALRRAEEPDVPFRAVEFSVKDGSLCQDRGYQNDRDGMSPGDKRILRAFWAAWRRAHRQRRTA